MDDVHTSACAKTREIFLEALEQSDASARAGFLDRACQGNPVLRANVEELLQFHRTDSFLETPAIKVSRTNASAEGGGRPAFFDEPTEKSGDRIGRYKLLQEIGEGGCGTVYMAEQEEPVRRRVALKIIKPGMDTKSVIARFEAERQALALMDHPNIARIYDGGATPAGRPYFVMELVCGTRITDFCDQNNLTTRERLLLFMQVCQAVQHAHQKSIIHRDLKPSNILVTLHDGVPMPKVIDFGIAKATEQRLTDKTVFTSFNMFVGTPAYTSPEQAESTSLDIDTRSDIYSLGVLLYELLTGKTPFDAKELAASGLDEMRRTILQKEPLCPSTRLLAMRENESTITAKRRQLDPGKLASQIRGDLDWMVMKALEKDRSRRYETASDFAKDVERHLNHEPILACPPSNLYRFQKMVRRHQLVFAAGSSISAVLIFGLVFSYYQILQKNKAYGRILENERTERQLRQKAENAQIQAEAQEFKARQKAYAADMNLAQQALLANNLGHAHELLEAQLPLAGSADLRGWEWRYLRKQCQSDALFTLCHLSNEVTAVAVSPDGKWVAINDNENQGISIWDLRSRQKIKHLANGHGFEQAIFAFSPVASILAFCDRQDGPPWEENNRIRLWDATASRYIGELPDAGSCFGLVFSADGQRLLTANRKGTLSIWSISEAKKLKDIPQTSKGQGGLMRPLLGATPDLRLAAYTTSGGKAIRVVDLSTGNELWTASAADEFVRALAFSPDGKTLASGAGFTESAIRLWDVASGKETGRLEGHRTWISALVFWPDGKKLASSSGDQTIRVWDVPSRSPLATLRGHQREVWGLALLPDNNTLISGSKDGMVCVWDASVRRSEKTFVIPPVTIQAWCFSSNSQSILVLDQQGRIVRCQGADFQDTQVILNTGARLFNPMFSPDSLYFAGETSPGIFKVWDLQQGTLLRECRTESRRIAFIPRSNHLLLQRFKDNMILEWDPATGSEVASWPALSGSDMRGNWVFSPDVQWAFEFIRDGEFRLLELSTRREHVLKLGMKQVTRVVFSPDHQYIAAVSVSASGGIWKTATQRKVADIHGFLQGLHSIAYSPDGKRLAIGSNGKEAVKLWSTESNQELVTLEGQGSMFGATAFSPDGNILASSNEQGLLHIWQAPIPAKNENIEPYDP